VSERHYGGLGLGLWVARHVSEAMGGHIRVSSAPGAGSKFVVTLPRVVAGGE
jgi:signal transduction histidine kinase